MTNAAVPSSLLPLESQAGRPPLSSMFLRSPLCYHIVIIYPPHSYYSPCSCLHSSLYTSL